MKPRRIFRESHQRRSRSLAIAACLVALIAIFYAVTWVKLSTMRSSVIERPPTTSSGE